MSKRKAESALARIWFHLYDDTMGKPYKGTSATCVELAPSSDIEKFKKAVKVEYSSSSGSLEKGIGN